MISRHSLETGVAPLKLEAIDWASRLAIGPVSDDDWHAFEAWRRSSPAHEDAFRTASAFMGELRTLDLPAEVPAGSNVVSLRPRAAISRRGFLGGGAVAATLAIGVAAQSPLGLWPSLTEMMADERTGAGQRTAFSPMAGVEIELSSRSSLSRAAQGVSLVSGEIFVAVRQLASDFHVDASGVRIAARSARINVRNYDGETCVTCIDGQVTTQRDDHAIALSRGQSAIYADGAAPRRTAGDPAVVTAWRRGLLIFEGTQLSAAISQINRFYPGRLMLSDNGLGERPITGVFHTDQIELAVVQIQNLTGANATRLPGGVVLLG